MAVIEIRGRKAAIKLFATDKRTIEKHDELLSDLAYDGSPVRDEAREVQQAVAKLKLALSPEKQDG